MSTTNSVDDQQRPADISDKNLANFKTKYHPCSKQPILFQTSNAFHVHKPSNPPQDPTPWHPFWCRGDFKFVEIALKASLNKKQVKALLSLIFCVAKGKAEVTFWSEAELHKLCNWATEELTPVSRCEMFQLHTVRYDANQVYYLQFVEHTISVSVSKSSWKLVQRLATGLDCNWWHLDCSCQLRSIVISPVVSCPVCQKSKRPVVDQLQPVFLRTGRLAHDPPIQGHIPNFFSYFYLFIWIY